jgi:hypothetical protein
MEPRLKSLAVILALVMIFPVASANGSQPASAELLSSSHISSVPENFDLTYSVKNYNATGHITYECELDFSSDGYAEYSETSLGGWPPDINASAILGQEFVDYLRKAMDDDEICPLNGTYNDANWQMHGPVRDVEVLVVRTVDCIKTLKFYGDAMVGILPNTYVAVNKIAVRTSSPSIDVLNISVDVSAHLGADATLSISASLMNNGPDNISMTGCSKKVWPAMIVRSNGCGIAKLDYTIASACVVTVAPGDAFQFEPHTWNASGLAVGRYVVMASPFLLGVTTFNVTQDTGHVNEAPKIYLLTSEPSDSNEHTYVFDASESCDKEDRITDLQVRWDWYSDGRWDTDWSFEKTAEYTFANMTGYNLTVEVRDTGGLVASQSRAMTISYETAFLPLSVLMLGSLATVIAVALLLLFWRKKKQNDPSSPL